MRSSKLAYFGRTQSSLEIAVLPSSNSTSTAQE